MQTQEAGFSNNACGLYSEWIRYESLTGDHPKQGNTWFYSVYKTKVYLLRHLQPGVYKSRAPYPPEDFILLGGV